MTSVIDKFKIRNDSIGYGNSSILFIHKVFGFFDDSEKNHTQTLVDIIRSDKTNHSINIADFKKQIFSRQTIELMRLTRTILSDKNVPYQETQNTWYLKYNCIILCSTVLYCVIVLVESRSDNRISSVCVAYYAMRNAFPFRV